MNTDRLSVCIGVPYGKPPLGRLRFQKQDFCHSFNSH